MGAKKEHGVNRPQRDPLPRDLTHPENITKLGRFLILVIPFSGSILVTGLILPKIAVPAMELLSSTLTPKKPSQLLFPEKTIKNHPKGLTLGLKKNTNQ